MLKMIPVRSSYIAYVGYDPDNMILRIQFAEGSVYDYHSVPVSIAQQFLAAPSKGKYYAEWIKGRFSPVRIQ